MDNAGTPKWEYIVEALCFTQKAGNGVPTGLKECASVVYTVADNEQVPNLADLEVVPPCFDRQADFRFVRV